MKLITTYAMLASAALAVPTVHHDAGNLVGKAHAAAARLPMSPNCPGASWARGYPVVRCPGEGGEVLAFESQSKAWASGLTRCFVNVDDVTLAIGSNYASTVVAQGDLEVTLYAEQEAVVGAGHAYRFRRGEYRNVRTGAHGLCTNRYDPVAEGGLLERRSVVAGDDPRAGTPGVGRPGAAEGTTLERRRTAGEWFPRVYLPDCGEEWNGFPGKVRCLDRDVPESFLSLMWKENSFCTAEYNNTAWKEDPQNGRVDAYARANFAVMDRGRVMAVQQNAHIAPYGRMHGNGLTLESTSYIVYQLNPYTKHHDQMSSGDCHYTPYGKRKRSVGGALDGHDDENDVDAAAHDGFLA